MATGHNGSPGGAQPQGYTEDDLLYGSLTIRQPHRGPRVNLDTVLLAAALKVKAGERFLDLGCAHGAVALLTAWRCPNASVEGLEIQPELAAMARGNAERNGLGHRIAVREGDLREHRRLFPPGGFDVLAVNPPYGTTSGGRPSPTPEEAVANHELCCTMRDVAEAAHYLLRSRGRIYIVFRAPRLVTLLGELSGRNMEPKGLRCVHPDPSKEAKTVLLKAVRDGRPGLKVFPPLFVRGSDGRESGAFLEAYTRSGLPCL
ncbi:MAG: methyltransferase [Synergistales bacterium]|nr:methyltransferase [Synergistales bacterium]